VLTSFEFPRFWGKASSIDLRVPPGASGFAEVRKIEALVLSPGKPSLNRHEPTSAYEPVQVKREAHSNEPTTFSTPSTSGGRSSSTLAIIGAKASSFTITLKSGVWSLASSGGQRRVREFTSLGGRNVYVIGSAGTGIAE
jgi:hypothetical protein